MQIIEGISKLNQALQKCVVTIGNFDGVHLGHQELLKRVLDLSRGQGLTSVLITFDPHPIQILYPDKAFFRLFDRQDQVSLLDKLGIDILIVEPFSRSLSQKSADEFFKSYILKPFSPTHLIVGYDFVFGANRQGTHDKLKELSENYGIHLEIIPPFKVDKMVVSSSSIRQALTNGDVESSKKLLGRPYYIEGVVIKGDGRGKKLGIPTANIESHIEVHIKSGVYIGYIYRDKEKLKAVVNIGYVPTFKSLHAPLSIEAHILDFHQDIYGEKIKFEFVSRLRDEAKFSSKEALKEQILKDIQLTKKLLQ